MDIISKMKKTKFIEAKIYICMIFIWLSPAMKQLLEKIYFEFLHTLSFPYTWNKEANSIR